jgi:hypothetical protein
MYYMKTKTITVRIEEGVEKELTKKIIKESEKKEKLISKSDYIRELIKKDLYE